MRNIWLTKIYSLFISFDKIRNLSGRNVKTWKDSVKIGIHLLRGSGCKSNISSPTSLTLSLSFSLSGQQQRNILTQESIEPKTLSNFLVIWRSRFRLLLFSSSAVYFPTIPCEFLSNKTAIIAFALKLNHDQMDFSRRE